MLPSQLWLVLDAAVLPGLALAHWSTQGWPWALVSGSSPPFPLAPQALAPSSARVYLLTQRVLCQQHWKRNRSVLLACVLLSPECLDEARLLLGLSQRVALDSTALLPAGFRRHRDNVGSALLVPVPRGAASILTVSLGSPQDRGMKSNLCLSTASQRGLLSAVGWQWSSTSYVQTAGNQYAEQLLPFLGTLFFKDSRVEGIRPSS